MRIRDEIAFDQKVAGLARDGWGRKLLVGLYFVREVGGETVKIGFSRIDPRQRLADLQRGNPRELEVFACLPGALNEDERDWHRRYSDARLVGEWFTLTDALRAEIDAKCLQGNALRSFIGNVVSGSAGLKLIRQWMADSGVSAEDIAKAGNFHVSRVRRFLEGQSLNGISLHMARVITGVADGAFAIDDIRPGTTKQLAHNAALRAKRKLANAKKLVASLERVAA